MQCKVKYIIVFSSLLLVLTGCLYPQDNLSKNQLPNDDQLQLVENAVLNYQEQEGGLLPIKTKDSETAVYEKYLIDFVKLKQANLLSETPGSAYENGGVYQYIIVNPEEDTHVKVIDLRNTDALRSANVSLNMYRSKHTYPPFGEEIEKGVYQVNYEALGLKEAPFVTSPYSGAELPIVMDQTGMLYIDYRVDLYQALNEFDHAYVNGDDILPILTDNYPFAPAYSLPMTVLEGDPVFLMD